MEKVLIKAPMVRKVSSAEEWQKEVDEWEIKDSNLIIENTVEVDSKEYDCLSKNFFKYRILIHDNLKHMWLDAEGWHVIAVTCKDRNQTILIESEGYDYARYTSVVSNTKLKEEGVKYGKADS